MTSVPDAEHGKYHRGPADRCTRDRPGRPVQYASPPFAKPRNNPAANYRPGIKAQVLASRNLPDQINYVPIIFLEATRFP
jgi:hypothetical protein